MKHGNILALFNIDDSMRANIESIVFANATAYKILGDLIFIATADTARSQNMLTALRGLNIEFLFYYNNISNGSDVFSNDANPELATIRQILL